MLRQLSLPLFLIVALALNSRAIAVSDTSSRVTDGAPQFTLEQALPNSDERHEIEEKLQLDLPFDFAAAERDGSLVARVKALKPLGLEGNTIPESGVTLSPKAYIAIGTLWRAYTPETPENLGAVKSNEGQYRLEISVCWISLTPESEHGRALTRQAIEATWQYHGAVKFTGWGQCRPNTGGIRIGIANVRASSDYGNLSTADAQSMSLDLTFADDFNAACRPKADLCIWSIAVHEFGHALGFIHEQDSNETPNWCKLQLSPGDIQTPEAKLKAKMITPWDRFSVMDYCFDIYAQRIQLSDCDIAALHKEYTTPVSPQYNYKPVCKTRD